MPRTPRARWPPTASQSTCRRRRRRVFFPISTHSRTNSSVAPSLSSLPRRRTRRARWPTSTISSAWSRSPADSDSWCSATNAIPRFTRGVRPPGCSKPPARTLQMWSSSSRCRSARTCRGCASDLPPAIEHSSRGFWSCATSRRRKSRYRRNAWRSPRMATRGMWRKIAASMRRNTISPIRSSASATAIGVPRVDSFSGSTFRRKAATRPWR